MAVLNSILGLVGLYVLCGLVFAIPFVLKGAGTIDPVAKEGTWGFKVLVIPGVLVFWPILARRWMSGATHPPEARNAHGSCACGGKKRVEGS